MEPKKKKNAKLKKFESLKRPKPPSKKVLLERARKRITLAEAWWSDAHAKSRNEVDFYMGNQWDQEAVEERMEEGRPAQTFNLCPALGYSVIGDVISNPPDIQVMSAPRGMGDMVIKNSKGEEVSKPDIWEGMMRYISYNGDAIDHYLKCMEQTVNGGFSWLRVREDYLSETSFERNLFVECIDDRWSVYVDPAASNKHYEDANWLAVKQLMSKDDFEEMYGNEAVPGTAFSSDTTGHGGETTQEHVDQVQITEYFERIRTDAVLVEYKMPSVDEGGRRKTIRFFDFDEMQEKLAELEAQGCIITNQRWTESHQVNWYHLATNEILKSGTWKGSRIPFVFVPGRVTGDKRAKRVYKSLFTDAQDAQIMINYFATAVTERMQTGEKGGYLGTPAMFDGFEGDYERAGDYNNAMKRFNQEGFDEDQKLQPPIHVPADTIPHAEMLSLTTFHNMLRSVTGITESKLGEKSNETSGEAIKVRREQGDIATLDFVHHLRTGVASVGKLFLELAPLYYDKNTVLFYMDAEYGTHEVDLNEYDAKDLLSAGGSSIRVVAGSSFVSMFQRIGDFLEEMIKMQSPAALPLFVEFVKHSGIPKAHQLAKRLLPLLPRETLLDSEKESVKPPDPTPEQTIRQTEMDAKKIEAEAKLTEAQLKEKEAGQMAEGGVSPEIHQLIQRLVAQEMGRSRSAQGRAKGGS